MSESTYSMQLSPATFILVSPPEESSGKAFRADLFKAWRMLEDSKKSPTEDHRWEKVIRWLADRLGIQETEVSESMAREFAEAVYSLGAMLDENLKKKLQTAMESWQNSTDQDSPLTGQDGTTDSSELTETLSQP